MMRAWRLAGQPSLQLQRLPRRLVAGRAAVRFLATADPGGGSAPRGTAWDDWSAMLFGQGRAETLPQQGDGVGGGDWDGRPGGDGQGRQPIEYPGMRATNAELHTLLEAGEQSKARELFDRLLDQGQVDENDLGRMMQACYTSTEMWNPNPNPDPNPNPNPNSDPNPSLNPTLTLTLTLTLSLGVLQQH